jgi:hypothetical protein
LCTSPIRPNDYQRLLYGNTLDSYVFVELIGAPLVAATKESIDLVLVEDEQFLAIRSDVDVPVVLLTRSTQDGNNPSIALRVHSGFETDRSVAQARLISLFNEGRDILEPFERVRLALEQAHMQKVGDKSK